MDGWKYWAKNKCDATRIVLRRHKDPSSVANGPSEIAVSVIVNVELKMRII